MIVCRFEWCLWLCSLIYLDKKKKPGVNCKTQTEFSANDTNYIDEIISHSKSVMWQIESGYSYTNTPTYCKDASVTGCHVILRRPKQDGGVGLTFVTAHRRWIHVLQFLCHDFTNAEQTKYCWKKRGISAKSGICSCMLCINFLSPVPSGVLEGFHWLHL